MLDLPRAAFSRLPRASDPLHLPVSKPVGVLARTFQGVTPSFHPSEYQFSGISAVHSLFSYKRVALFPWSTAINIAVYLLILLLYGCNTYKSNKNEETKIVSPCRQSARRLPRKASAPMTVHITHRRFPYRSPHFRHSAENTAVSIVST